MLVSIEDLELKAGGKPEGQWRNDAKVTQTGGPEH
jgi:hypothetical protein